MSVLVRRATVSDLDQIALLFDGYRQFYGQVSDIALARDFLHQRLSRQESVIFVAFDTTDKALGFTQLFLSFSSIRTRRIFILNDLFVASAGRRQGIGALLLKAAADFGGSQGAARLSLSTAIDNETAQRLYESNGWKRDEVFYHYNLTL